ncbi:uncharacterized protein LOC62_07G008975 [Vanrija pseudolonga]|uniref:Yeast cell wall synthesis Kre9/Knh1-like N-terminal domain-containing protein n=1 Tax=Vanrija pseudolonga TaxID=143232 RepID=A0AAF0YIW7_9TREE|nr:hypothetical protein LOC62_07G008975 [Vanrija pseudolonga]
MRLSLLALTLLSSCALAQNATSDESSHNASPTPTEHNNNNATTSIAEPTRTGNITDAPSSSATPANDRPGTVAVGAGQSYGQATATGGLNATSPLNGTIVSNITWELPCQDINATVSINGTVIPIVGTCTCILNGTASFNGTAVGGKCPDVAPLPGYVLPGYSWDKNATKVTSPTSNSGWVAGTQSTVEWTWPADGNHTQLAIRLARVNTSADVSSNFYAVVNSSDLKATQGITPFTPPGSGYFIRILNYANQSMVYASSPEFEIKSAGSKPSGAARAAAPGALAIVLAVAALL